MILLSILIPGVPRRHASAEFLWRKLEEQLENISGVELLMLRDNKTRSTGAKRQALLDISQGRHISFVDDDDDVAANYVSRIMGKIDVPEPPDLVVFPIRCTINGYQEGMVVPSITHVNKPIQEYAAPLTPRPPHHLCCWKREIAIQGKFPDIQHGEDFSWAKQIWPLVRTEAAIEACLYHYRWDEDVTEAEPI